MGISKRDVRMNNCKKHGLDEIYVVNEQTVCKLCYIELCNRPRK